MLKKILLASFIIWMSYGIGTLSVMYYHIYQSHREAEEQLNKQEQINKMTYPQMVSYVAPQFNQDPHKIKEIIYNESGFKIQSHDGGRAKNITAIHNTTFKIWLPEYEKEVGETLSIDSQYDQIKLMSWAFSKGEEYRDDWTTYVACESPNKTYSFYSKQLGKHFTVHCQPLPKQYDII